MGNEINIKMVSGKRNGGLSRVSERGGLQKLWYWQETKNDDDEREKRLLENAKRRKGMEMGTAQVQGDNKLT